MPATCSLHHNLRHNLQYRQCPHTNTGSHNIHSPPICTSAHSYSFYTFPLSSAAPVASWGISKLSERLVTLSAGEGLLVFSAEQARNVRSEVNIMQEWSPTLATQSVWERNVNILHTIVWRVLQYSTVEEHEAKAALLDKGSRRANIIQSYLFIFGNGNEKIFTSGIKITHFFYNRLWPFTCKLM